MTVFSFGHCKTVKNDKSNSIKQITSIDMQEGKITVLNTEKTMELIVIKTGHKGDPATHFKYSVYDLKTKEIIKKGKFRGVAIGWNDNSSLKLTPYIGMEREPNVNDLYNTPSKDKPKTQIIIINLLNQ